LGPPLRVIFVIHSVAVKDSPEILPD